SQPSNVGLTSCPRAYATWAAAREAPPIQTPMTRTAHPRRFMASPRADDSWRRASLLDFSLVLVVRHQVVTEPRAGHFVDRSLSVSDLGVRIRVELVGGGVVVPLQRMQNGPCRQQRRGIVAVNVVEVPVEEEPRAVQHLRVQHACFGR